MNSSESSHSIVWIIIAIALVLMAIVFFSIVIFMYFKYKSKRASEQEIQTKGLESISEQTASSVSIRSTKEEVPIGVQKSQQNPQKM
jgi:flagellar basal body-associated protein FliL